MNEKPTALIKPIVSQGYARINGFIKSSYFMLSYDSWFFYKCVNFYGCVLRGSLYYQRSQVTNDNKY